MRFQDAGWRRGQHRRRKSIPRTTSTRLSAWTLDLKQFAYAFFFQHLFEVHYGAHKPLLERHARRPSQHVGRLGDIGLTLARIVCGEWPAHDLRTRSRNADDELSELAN